jgi:acid phosphatase
MLVPNRMLAAAAALLALTGTPLHAAETGEAAIGQIQTIVVIYAENRSFQNLYSHFPGATGLQEALAAAPQRDRDGSILPVLPPIWGGLTAAGVKPVVTQAQTENMANAPFSLEATYKTGLDVVTRDLWHRFYQNQMQIHGGKNDMFAAWADSGGLVMGYYDGSELPLGAIARRYTLADHFFIGAFGGSFLNHQYLICACAPYYPDAAASPAKPTIAKVEEDGVTLTAAAGGPGSALNGPPKFASDGNLTPDFYAVNTMQPPYQPSANKPAQGQDPAYANPANATTLPPQTASTIGDLLSRAGVSWAWYSGAWQATLDGKNALPAPNFQFHHQPFNYYAAYAPGTAARAEHLRDGGMDGAAFIAAIDAGTLPQVAFYKPQGNLNEHAGYADVTSGDAHIADIVGHLERSPQWPHMLVVVTWDENGGWWDSVAPPKADRWGPGSRIPALVISPFAKKGYVDSTQYDTSSILRLITKRFALPPLPGLTERDAAMARNGSGTIGDFANALALPQ